MLKSCGTLIVSVKCVIVQTREKAPNAGVMSELLLCMLMHYAWACDCLNSVDQMTLMSGVWLTHFAWFRRKVTPLHEPNVDPSHVVKNLATSPTLTDEERGYHDKSEKHLLSIEWCHAPFLISMVSLGTVVIYCIRCGNYFFHDCSSPASLLPLTLLRSGPVFRYTFQTVVRIRFIIVTTIIIFS